jgi:hypothetical protein
MTALERIIENPLNGERMTFLTTDMETSKESSCKASQRVKGA